MQTLMAHCGHHVRRLVLQARLGHKSMSTTMNIYGHVLPVVDREAADRSDEVFKQAKH